MDDQQKTKMARELLDWTIGAFSGALVADGTLADREPALLKLIDEHRAYFEELAPLVVMEATAKGLRVLDHYCQNKEKCREFLGTPGGELWKLQTAAESVRAHLENPTPPGGQPGQGAYIAASHMLRIFEWAANGLPPDLLMDLIKINGHTLGAGSN